MTAFLSLHEAIAEQTDWPMRLADKVEQTPNPSENELAVLRDLQARTERAHHRKARAGAGAA